MANSKSASSVDGGELVGATTNGFPGPNLQNNKAIGHAIELLKIDLVGMVNALAEKHDLKDINATELLAQSINQVPQVELNKSRSMDNELVKPLSTPGVQKNTSRTI